MIDYSAAVLSLGIGKSGEVVQCGRNSAEVLGRPPEDVVGADVTSLFADEHKASLTDLLDGDGGGRERSAVLGEAIVSVQPMMTRADDRLALMTVKIPAPTPQRFADPAFMRRALLSDALPRIGSTLDLDQLGTELATVVVPHFCIAAGVLVQESIMASDEVAEHGPESGEVVFRRVAIASDDDGQRWNAAFPVGEVLTYPPGSPYNRCMASGQPVLHTKMTVEGAKDLARTWRREPVAGLLGDTSMLLLPLIADGAKLGFVVCVRTSEHRGFDASDVEIGMEFAGQAALFIDNARRYSRERATALTLQRSMLPVGLTHPSSVELRHRYLPGNQLIEIGGDWYESIALPGGRVALVVGDVAGHGVRAAITMGRLRTALRTIVNLELSPSEVLKQLDVLMREMGDRGPAFATCVYAVYDATSGKCEIASAGHLQPLLLTPGGTAEYLDIPPAPPLGIGDGLVDSRTFTIGDGSLLVLYTDGLVENRGQDIDDGLARLRRVFEPDALFRPLEDLAKATLVGAYSDHNRDDIAVLIARLRRLPEDNIAWWTLPSTPTSVRDARGKVRTTMEGWGLDALSFTVELAVSELVTNALRYGSEAIAMRLLRDRTLVCEVYDDSEALPRARQAADDEESGRGLQVVQRLAKRWGARPTTAGKVVWCEIEIPGEDEHNAETWPGESHHRSISD